MRVVAATLSALVSVGCAPHASRPDAPAASASGAEIEVRRAVGLNPAQVRAFVTPSLASLHRCAPGSGGKVNVAITATDGALQVSIEPGPSLNPLLRECVLQALSTLDVEESGGNAPGVSVRPSGFTSLVAISW